MVTLSAFDGKQPRLNSHSVKLNHHHLFNSSSNTISYVSYDLKKAEKFTLMVDGKPYYMTNIQVRLDKLRYYSTYSWSWAQCEALIAQAASDGFNTVSLPIQWYEVEPQKDKFDWAILDNYLNMVNKYHLRMELLWFGANSTGKAVMLGNAAGVSHLRVPDYVLYSPNPGKNDPATTSEYTIDRKYGNYTLDITDQQFKAREIYVLGKIMAHIAEWDAANGKKHPVIGVQLDNEFRAGSHDSAANDIAYLSALGAAVKNSPYVVWTRMNAVHRPQQNIIGKVAANERLRDSIGTNLDFIGIDNYSNDEADIQSTMPTMGKNFKMVMENNGHNNGRIKLAALAGNTMVDTYNMCGPDDNNLYEQTTKGNYTPHGDNINEVRVVNHLILSDPVDLATKAQNKSLFVHNWQAKSAAPATGGNMAITYNPSSITDMGVSIKRSDKEIVLMSIQGGTFTLPAQIKIKSASKGFFNDHNTWVDKGRIDIAGSSVSVTTGTTVRLTY